MARKRRIFIEDCPWHIWQRGVDRATTFHGPDDFRLYLGLLQELAPQFECAIHAYVLMTNHVHLLATPRTSSSCPSLMKHLGQRYAQAANRRWGRSGPLWDGRYKSSLVDSTRYELICQRYIELNPVRAGMVRHAGEYPWSSFRCNAFGVASPLLTPGPVYQGLADDDDDRLAAYRGLFDEAETPETLKEIRTALNRCAPLGGQTFMVRIAELSDKASIRIGNARRKRKGATPEPQPETTLSSLQGGLTPV